MGAPSVAFVRTYESNIQMLAQQHEFNLMESVMIDHSFKGEKKFYDQYGTDDMVELVSRFQDTPVQSGNHARRMVTPRYFVSNTLEDPTDALQMLIDPKSTYMQAKKSAANRKKDDITISAFGGTSYSGQNGTTTNTLSGTSLIAAGGTGLTKLKMIQSKVTLDENEVEKEDRFFAHSASQLGDLLNTTEVTSSDFNVVKALVEGSLNTWLGFKMKHTERLLTDDASARLCYAYQKKGIQLAIQKEVTGRVDERNDKNYAWQVYLSMSLGSVRLEEVRVIQVKCVETF